MFSIYPPKSTLDDIHDRFQTADHTEEDFEDLLVLAKRLMEDLEDEKARNFNLEMDSFFARGGQIPNQ
jgi:hypothetical protein